MGGCAGRTPSARTFRSGNESSALPALKFDFTVDHITELSLYAKNSVLLSVVPNTTGSLTILQIVFPDETQATAFLNAVSKAESVKADAMPKPADSLAAPARASNAVTQVGAWILVAGIAVVAYFVFFFSTAVDVPSVTIYGQQIGGGQVNNLGLMADRTNGIVIRVGACLLGAALWLFGGAKAASK